MIALLIESALRSLLLAAVVWVALRLLRVHSIPAQRAAWIIVLSAAVLMPLLAPLASHGPQSLTLTIPAPPAMHAVARPTAESSSAKESTDSSREIPSTFTSPAGLDPAPYSAKEMDKAEPLTALGQPVPQHHIASGALAAAYLFVASVLLLRLLFGLAATLRIWMLADPICLDESKQASALSARSSASISCPVTIGSGILLPQDYVHWDAEKLRIVLAHERAHVRNGDFYLQLLADLYAAIFWLSPLGWWLKHKLGDLAEAISDYSGLEEAANRSSYAKVLLEFAAAPRPILIGVPMAQSSKISRRIERVLNERSFRQAFAAGRRALVATVLFTAALFTVATLLRVEAATQAPVIGQSKPAAPKPPAAPVMPPPSVAPEAPQAPSTPSAVQPAAPVVPDTPVAPVPPVPQVGPIHVDVPEIHVNVPEHHIDIPAIHVNVPEKHIDVPAQHIDVPATHVDVPAQHFDIPAQKIDVPPVHVDVPAIHIDVPAAGAQKTSGDHSFYGSAGPLYAMLTGWGHALFQAAAPSAAAASTESTFDRTLTFNGKLDLKIGNGAGNIHLSRGQAGQLKVHARVSSSSQADAEQVRSLAANPPIVQDGNSIVIGDTQHQSGTNHIRIDYEIEGPADAALQAASGSGEITDEGVGHAAKLATGSGKITATGLDGGFKAETGSGAISVESSGEGEARVETGSGDIIVKNVRGALKAETGSGSIQASGTPSSPWQLNTGTGNIDLTIGNAPINLNASTGSGKISSAQGMAMQTASDRHHFRGAVNGGGPEVKAQTGTGNISIH